VGSGSHARQTADIMTAFEAYLLDERPDWVLVYGDVNSTVAAALVCTKLHIPVAHVEAGLRSGDRRMPEEVNRVVTDSIANLLLTPSPDADANLAREGVPASRIRFIGNVMIDTLKRLKPAADERWPALAQRHALEAGNYMLITLHRPSNVDDPEHLAALMQTLAELSEHVPALFPVHPRTRARLSTLDLDLPASLMLTHPVGYLDFLALQSNATLVVTDSGGLQEETTVLGVPCLTLRESTERPVTITEGTNVLIGRDLGRLRQEAHGVLAGTAKTGTVPAKWDGQAGERIAEVFASL
ncbi:MAG: UDP-N-acetylglucosamine 2-epimerase (non-hydrolyzing), partial [Bacteroidota bacterium]